jgi:hypothetical protein
MQESNKITTNLGEILLEMVHQARREEMQTPMSRVDRLPA